MSLATSPVPRRAPAPPGRESRSEPSDETLLARFAASDPEATAVFVERFRRRVFGLAFAILGESGAAEDVAQEALLRAWRRAAVFDTERGSVVTWLLTITRNLAIDSTRVRMNIASDPHDMLRLSRSHAALDPADAFELPDGADQLRDALTALSEKQRRAVVLARVWGLSAREVAAREQIPVGTAKTRIHIALGRLREVMIDEERSA